VQVLPVVVVFDSSSSFYTKSRHCTKDSVGGDPYHKARTCCLSSLVSRHRRRKNEPHTSVTDRPSRVVEQVEFVIETGRKYELLRTRER
jgi:hypothetical protein